MPEPRFEMLSSSPPPAPRFNDVPALAAGQSGICGAGAAAAPLRVFILVIARPLGADAADLSG